MVSARNLTLSLMVIVILSSLSLAQIGPQMPSLRGNWNPVVGAGAAYDVQTPDHKMSMEVGVVGKESVEGVDGFWLEITMGTNMTMKSLIAGGEAKRMIFQQGSEAPMEMSLDMVRMMPKAMQPKGPGKDIRETAKLIGKESVTVPAGTFACDHYQDTEGGRTVDVWVSSDAAPYGVVKMTGPNTSVVLTQVIKDYRSKITRAPKKM